jgi:hypothetical protein
VSALRERHIRRGAGTTVGTGEPDAGADLLDVRVRLISAGASSGFRLLLVLLPQERRELRELLLRLGRQASQEAEVRQLVRLERLDRRADIRIS